MRQSGAFAVIVFIMISLNSSAETSVDIAAGVSDCAAPRASVSLALASSDERLLGETGALAWNFEARGWGSEARYGTAGAARIEVSRVFGSLVSVARASLEGAADSLVADTFAKAGLSASLVANGDAASLTLSPWCDVTFGVDSGLTAGIEGKMSALAGSVVLEPGAAVSLGATSEGLVTLIVTPILGVSWYPSIPLAADVGGRYEATLDTSGAWSSSWAGQVNFSGVLGDGILFACSAHVESALGVLSAGGSADVSLPVSSSDDLQIVLIARIAVDYPESADFTIAPSCGLRIAW